MTPPYSSIDLTTELDAIERIHPFAAIFEYCETSFGKEKPSMNDDAFEEYENLYLVPC